ncbi:MAG TPA: acyl-CoA dehydrogenase family protein [Pseudonocardia sp.]|uniref:acyl-CoA dehydrogenase family protein n=1 Tax=Pseudonocardia sp. TaxID=60912 RepID=UPI002BBE6EA7|nr:acyl-CoA dehydrogenase family protein [Pseudonocardia sp.]HTF53799.1 acyl-CoA dehydrogenase family protein [Pseudonocardia sp.]
MSAGADAEAKPGTFARELRTDRIGETRPDWVALAREVGPAFAERAAGLDETDAFVAENYAELNAHRFFSAGVPAELGGGGASHRELCAMLRELARHCGSTALALSMHTHLLGATVWRWRQEQPVEPLLRRIAEEQIVLISTGASDWLDSSGTAEQVEGGYRVTGRKIFGSGSPAGTLLVTSAVYDDPAHGPSVLHFPVPIAAEGVTVLNNWRTLGMRATGSHDVLLENVFVPEGAVSLRRPQGQWHTFFNVVVTVALPLVLSVYVGVAEAASDLARGIARKKSRSGLDPNLPYLLGEMDNALVTAQLAVHGMANLCDDYAFEPTVQTANAVLIRKTVAANACIQTVEKAFEVVGGGAFFRSVGLERLLRDVHGAQFHPLQEKRQHLFTGRVALGLDPVG